MKSGFGVMFHHFHGANHPVGQGSISATDLDLMISKLQKEFHVLNIHEFALKALEGQLDEMDTCLTFDDSLLCQYEIALPVVEAHGLLASFNIYSSAFSGTPDPLEVYRYFRSVSYKNFEDFFLDFIHIVKLSFLSEYRYGLLKFASERAFFDDFPFYTENDKIFRFFRDRVLGPKLYDHVMVELMKAKEFDTSEVPKKVFMTESHLKKLHQQGHVLGLHSDSHPTQMHTLSEEEQLNEFTKNFNFLVEITGVEPKTMAHPCGQYNKTTLDILNDLGISIGFCSSLKSPYAKSLLELPREDHSNIMQQMKLS